MKRPAFHIVITLIVSLFFVHGGFAYIPSAEQILQPFLKAYSNLDTIKIDMDTVIYDDLYDISQISEQVFIKKGGIFRAARSFSHGDNILIQDGEKTLNLGVDTANAHERRLDTVFPSIFFQDSVGKLINVLSSLGVETGSINIDRINGDTAFVAGAGIEPAPGSQLWIDRERNLPLRFVGVTMSEGERVVLRAEYLNYLHVQERFWLPQRIEYYRDDVLWVVSILKDITLNEKLSESLFLIPEDEGGISPVLNFLNIKE